MKKFIITTVLAFALATTASAAPLKPTTLRVGSTGQTVMTVQQKLLDLGLSDSAVDGKYGRKTAVAVAKFQLSKNLKSDGLVGEKTLALILASKTSSTIQSSIDSSSMKTETVSTSVTTNNTAPVVPVKTTTIDATASRTTKPIIDVPIVIPDVPLSDEVAWRILCRDIKPHIQVLSPNGGDIYQAGQQVEVKWRSCNVHTDSTVIIDVDKPSMNHGYSLIPATNVPGAGGTNVTRNDGQEVVTIPNVPLYNYTNFPYGSDFKLRIWLSPTAGAYQGTTYDLSDNLFTINASQPKVQVGTSATNPPASTVLASQTQTTNNVRLLGFTVKATGTDLVLKRIPVQVNSTGSNIQNIVSQLKLVDGSGNVLQTADTMGNYISSGSISTSTGCLGKDCGYFFNNLGNIVIPNGTTKEFSIVADLRAMNASGGGYAVGNTIKASIANSDVISSSNLGVTNQNGDNLIGNSSYRIGSALGNVITIGAAQTDMCPNISGIQTTIPAGMIKDVSGNCVVVSSVSSPTSMWENLCTDGQPRAQIISPNGNEWYRAGQQMEVKWKTCNHPAGATIQVGYMWSDSANGPGGYQNDTAVNDGIETYDLGVNAYNGEWRFSGKYYKAFVGFSSTNRDYSDDFFTIWDGNIIKPSPRANSVN